MNQLDEIVSARQQEKVEKTSWELELTANALKQIVNSLVGEEIVAVQQ